MALIFFHFTIYLLLLNSAASGSDFDCFECYNKIGDVEIPDCPKNRSVSTKVTRVKCASRCYTWNDPKDDSIVFRGCTDSLPTLPSKLPESGCYSWKGSTICLCNSNMCNSEALGISNGLPLDPNADVSTTNTPRTTTTEAMKPIGENFSTQCFDCRSISNDNYNDWCPKNGSVSRSRAYLGSCKGPCFTRGDATDSDLVVRGCTANQGTLPNPLPREGCYDWNGATFCVCYKPECNVYALGTSIGVALDDHLSRDPGAGTTDGPLQCYQCVNYNSVDGSFIPQCPKDERVNSQRVYYGNCTGACFTRTYKNNSTMVGRGCTSTQYGLPEPLPQSGCYNWNEETWCICNTSYCNGAPIGVSSGKEFDDHITFDNFIEPDGVKKCYQCINYSNGTFYPQCDKYSKVRNAYFGPCNETCFTRSYDQDARVVIRGCTNIYKDLPNPLPPNGCYKWYTETWCVCSNSRCNGAPLGTPMDKEFDEHIHKNHAGNCINDNRNYFVLLSLIFTLFKLCQSV